MIPETSDSGRPSHMIPSKPLALPKGLSQSAAQRKGTVSGSSSEGCYISTIAPNDDVVARLLRLMTKAVNQVAPGWSVEDREDLVQDSIIKVMEWIEHSSEDVNDALPETVNRPRLPVA